MDAGLREDISKLYEIAKGELHQTDAAFVMLVVSLDGKVLTTPVDDADVLMETLHALAVMGALGLGFICRGSTAHIPDPIEAYTAAAALEAGANEDDVMAVEDSINFYIEGLSGSRAGVAEVAGKELRFSEGVEVWSAIRGFYTPWQAPRAEEE